jgi:hypothetical protein
MERATILSVRIVKKIIMSFGIVIANALSEWTEHNIDTIQGLCLISLLFIAAIQLNRGNVQPKLIRFVCLLYCNQQVRHLFVNGDNTAFDIFPNLLLATALAVLLTIISDRKDGESIDDLKTMLEGLMYMYGDMLDFLFAYDTISITLAAFAIGLFMQCVPLHTDPIVAFYIRLSGIISTNLLYQGVTTVINSTTHMKLIESIAVASVLRLLIPSMESYLTYLTAIQVSNIIPGISPAMLCAIAWIDILPFSSRGWITEVCGTYIILAVINFLALIPAWGSSVILIMAHYIDHIITNLK